MAGGIIANEAAKPPTDTTTADSSFRCPLRRWQQRAASHAGKASSLPAWCPVCVSDTGVPTLADDSKCGVRGLDFLSGREINFEYNLIP